ncbi:MAG: peptide deformylase [Candidatus Riflebacteria bacterium]|nr:peptide deformylase [Candidatus Riflebacteria bacterium]
MALLKVAVLGNPCLRVKTQPIKKSELVRESLQRFIDDLVETMREYDGVGLAATQVHQPLRICAVEVPAGAHRGEPAVPLTVLVNPELTPLSERREKDWEGCLSVPEMRGLVPRWTKLHVEAMDRKGNPLSFDASGFFARAIQHETDHLDGFVYLDRMEDLTSLTYLREFGRYWRDHQTDESGATLG